MSADAPRRHGSSVKKKLGQAAGRAVATVRLAGGKTTASSSSSASSSSFASGRAVNATSVPRSSTSRSLIKRAVDDGTGVVGDESGGATGMDPEIEADLPRGFAWGSGFTVGGKDAVRHPARAAWLAEPPRSFSVCAHAALIVDSDGVTRAIGRMSLKTGKVGPPVKRGLRKPTVVPVLSRRKVAATSISETHVVAVCDAPVPGTVVGWGGNAHGQLGQGDMLHKNLPVTLAGAAGPAVDARAGKGFTLVVTADGELYGCGDTRSGAFGGLLDAAAQQQQKVTKLRRIEIPPPAQEASSAAARGKKTTKSKAKAKRAAEKNAARVERKVRLLASASTFWLAAVEPGGALVAAGSCKHGALGLGAARTLAGTVAEVALPDGCVGPVVHVAVSEKTAIAVTADGAFLAAGSNARGQLGLGGSVERADTFARVDVPFDAREVASVAAGPHHTLVALANGDLYAAGDPELTSLPARSALFRRVNVFRGAAETVFATETSSFCIVKRGAKVRHAMRNVGLAHDTEAGYRDVVVRVATRTAAPLRRLARLSRPVLDRDAIAEIFRNLDDVVAFSREFEAELARMLREPDRCGDARVALGLFSRALLAFGPYISRAHVAHHRLVEEFESLETFYAVKPGRGHGSPIVLASSLLAPLRRFLEIAALFRTSFAIHLIDLDDFAEARAEERGAGAEDPGGGVDRDGDQVVALRATRSEAAKPNGDPAELPAELPADRDPARPWAPTRAASMDLILRPSTLGRLRRGAGAEEPVRSDEAASDVAGGGAAGGVGGDDDDGHGYGHGPGHGKAAPREFRTLKDVLAEFNRLEAEARDVIFAHDITTPMGGDGLDGAAGGPGDGGGCTPRGLWAQVLRVFGVEALSNDFGARAPRIAAALAAAPFVIVCVAAAVTEAARPEVAGALVTVLIFGFVLFLAAVVGFGIFRVRDDPDFTEVRRCDRVRKNRHNAMASALIGLEFLQLSSMAFQPEYGWPGETGMSQVLPPLAGAVPGVVVAARFVVLILLFGFWVTVTLLFGKLDRDRDHAQPLHAGGGVSGGDAAGGGGGSGSGGGDTGGAGRRRRRRDIAHAVVTNIAPRLLTGPLYIPFVRNAFSLLDCTYSDAGMPPTLDADASVVCWRGGHLFFALVAMLAIASYVPSATLTPYHAHREFLPEKLDLRLVPLFVMLVQVGKAAVTLASIFASSQPHFVLATTFAVLMVLAALAVRLRPGSTGALSVVKVASFVAAAWTMLMGMATVALDDGSNVGPTAGVLVGWSAVGSVTVTALWRMRRPDPAVENAHPESAGPGVDEVDEVV